MIIFLLIIIAIGVLLISESGRALLGGLIGIGMLLVGLVVGGIVLLLICLFWKDILPAVIFFGLIITLCFIVAMWKESENAKVLVIKKYCANHKKTTISVFIMLNILVSTVLVLLLT